jgi:hypothetical protein
MMIHYNSACPWSHAPPIAVSFCNREFYPKQLTDSALCVKRGIQEVLIHDCRKSMNSNFNCKRAHLYVILCSKVCINGNVVNMKEKKLQRHCNSEIPK